MSFPRMENLMTVITELPDASGEVKSDFQLVNKKILIVFQMTRPHMLNFTPHSIDSLPNMTHSHMLNFTHTTLNTRNIARVSIFLKPGELEEDQCEAANKCLRVMKHFEKIME